MVYLLWGVLNIWLVLFFVVICFKATKLIRRELGLLAAIVFVFGCCSGISHTNNNNDNKEPNSNHIKTWKFVNEDSIKFIRTDLTEIKLEKTLISIYELGIKYGKDEAKNIIIPISAYSSITGLESGTSWKPISIIINTTADKNKFAYEVLGTVEWHLLGTTIYYEHKDYKGFLIIN